MKIVTIISFFFFLYSCTTSEESDRENHSNTKTDSVAISANVPERIDSNVLALQPHGFIAFADSLTNKKCTVKTDSVVSENVIKTTYKIISKETRDLYTWYEIFHFRNDSLATDFFNDLKTREMILPFGIDKRPKHILVNGNIVIFHHMEHSYGHRYKEINAVFNSVIRMRKSAHNLDSISGFIYCNCHHQKADLSPLLGKWKSVKTTPVLEDTTGDDAISDVLKIKNPQEITILIYKDSIRINESVAEYFYPPSSLELPDVFYFIKYRFHSPFSNNTELTESMKKESEEIQQTRQPYFIYDFYLKGHMSIDFLQLKNNQTYLFFNNKLYELRRVSGV